MRGRMYCFENKEHERQRGHEYYLTHKEETMERVHRRRSRILNAPVCDLTIKQWEFIKFLYNFRCVYCGAKPRILTKDHIIPLSNGGSHTASNIVPACKSCNSKKNTGPVLRPVQPVLLCP